jgi:molybdate transport system substrate-binding protein
MKIPAKRLFLALGIAILFVSPALAGEVSLSAAASLKDALNELTEGFGRQHPGVRFLKNYGASGTLAKQVENGATADIFISANQEWVDYLKQKKLLDLASVATFAYNTLVFAGNPASKVGGMQDLPRLEKIAIGSPKSVPAGEYALQALKRAGIDRQVEKRLVMARDVRECLMYAERGEVDGAFVYRTDALQAKTVKILFTVPQELYSRVTYPMGLTVSGSGKPDAVAFYRYLQSAQAKKVLQKYGFAER